MDLFKIISVAKISIRTMNQFITGKLQDKVIKLNVGLQ